VIGVHSPEFEKEREPRQVRREVKKLEIEYPVILDNDFKMWDALGNHYWPTLYLIDRKGGIRLVHVGETREGSGPALRVEEAIEALLASED
jgi:hypothetical protein